MQEFRLGRAHDSGGIRQQRNGNINDVVSVLECSVLERCNDGAVRLYTAGPYTQRVKKMCQSTFFHNFDKCWPIF